MKIYLLSTFLVYSVLAYPAFAQSTIEDKTQQLFLQVEDADVQNKIQAYIELLDYLVITSPDKAIAIAEDAYRFAANLNDSKGKAEASLYLGTAYLKLHNPLKALDFITESFQIMNTVGDSAGICRSKVKLGVLRIVTGDISEAIEYFFQVENLASRINDIRCRIDALNYLGIINYILDNYDIAISYSESALKLSKENNYIEGKSLAYEHLGIINIRLRNYEKALDYNTKAYELRKELDDLTVITEIYDNYSVIYNRLNDIDKAIEYTEKSMKLREQYGDVNGMGSNFMGLGSIYKSLNNLDLALDYYRKAYTIKREANDLRAFTVILRNLSEIYEQKNDFQNAFNFLREFRAYNDSLFGENSRRLLLRAEAKHLLEKQEAEIKSLREINSIQGKLQDFLIIIIILVTLLAFAIIIVYLINRSSNKKLNEVNKQVLEQRNSLQKLNDELVALNKDRDKFFSVIAHDLRSPFSPLLSYSDVIITEIDKLKKDEIALYAKNINISGKRIYSLLENLLQWLGINSGKMRIRPKSFDLKVEIPLILELFNDSADQKGIKLTNSITQSTIVYADKEMIGIVFRNLIANAIKYSNIGDRVTISSELKGNHVECAVEDSGIGMDEETIGNLFTTSVKSSHGTNNEIGSGLGLLLCKEMIEKNGGTINVESGINKGSKFIFTIPVSDLRKLQTISELESRLN